MSGYGVEDFLQFTAQGNRTASLAVTAVDEKGMPTQVKLMPVIGIWPLSDLSGNPAPAATPSAFNTVFPGTTRLDAQFSSGGGFRVGVADARGDGRPDYFYFASFLYSDTVSPARVSVKGGPVSLHGFGFHPGLQVSVLGAASAVLSASAQDLQASVPPLEQLLGGPLQRRRFADDGGSDLRRGGGGPAVTPPGFGTVNGGGRGSREPDSRASGSV